MTSKLVAIIGGSASGKTTLANQLQSVAGCDRAVVLSLDSFYRSNSDKSLEERAAINYDHPDAFDSELLLSTLTSLHSGKSVGVPVYDYTTHSRREQNEICEALEIIIVEGILVFAFPDLLPLFAYSVFVDTSETVRLERRIQRDIRERGRTKESVLSQWQESVQPMYNRYCRPLCNKASEVFPGEQWSIEDVTALLKRIIAR